jgi:hypothetical protein
VPSDAPVTFLISYVFAVAPAIVMTSEAAYPVELPTTKLVAPIAWTPVKVVAVAFPVLLLADVNASPKNDLKIHGSDKAVSTENEPLNCFSKFTDASLSPSPYIISKLFPLVKSVSFEPTPNVLFIAADFVWKAVSSNP